MRRHRERTAAEHGVADAGIGAAFEGRDDDLVAADLDDLAAARAGMAALLDDVAQPGDVGKAAHLVVRGRDFGDAAAAPQQRLGVAETPPDPLQRGKPVFRRGCELPFERAYGWLVDATCGYFEPSVLIASSVEESVWRISAAVFSKAR